MDAFYSFLKITLEVLRNEHNINYVWLQMARIEMDCNLKKMANFFKFFPFVLEKLLYTLVSTFVWFVQLNSPKHGKSLW